MGREAFGPPFFFIFFGTASSCPGAPTARIIQ